MTIGERTKDRGPCEAEDCGKDAPAFVIACPSLYGRTRRKVYRCPSHAESLVEDVRMDLANGEATVGMPLAASEDF